jgi:hypothetical protein
LLVFAHFTLCFGKEKANELEAEITQGLESTELKSLSDYLERINAKINNQQEDEKGC